MADVALHDLVFDTPALTDSLPFTKDPTTTPVSKQTLLSDVKDLVYPPVMVGDSGSGGVAGLVPAPSAGDAAAGKVLGADSNWVAPVGALGDLTDVSEIGATTGQVLTYKADGSKDFQDPPASAPIGIGDLTDVIEAGATTGQVLTKRSDGDYDFEDLPTQHDTLNGLTDVNTAGGATGDVLTQQSDGSFALEAPAGGAVALNDLTDVNTAGGSTGDVLTQKSDGSFEMKTPTVTVTLDLIQIQMFC